MRRIGKLLGGLSLAGTSAAVLPAPGPHETQVAGDRPGLRADRQGGRHARGAGQAAGHRRPRGGQADLRPRDDQAARPGEEIEKILDPESHARKAGRRSDRSRNGDRSGPSSAGRSTPSSGTTSRSSWSTTSPCDGGSWPETLTTRLKAIAEQVDDPRRREGRSAEARGRPRADRTPALAVLPPRLEAADRGSRRPSPSWPPS